MVKPAAVMVRSTTRGIVAHPSPAIPIFPNPTAGLVRSPVGTHSGTPHVAVFRHAGPGAGGIQILRAVDAGADVAGTGGLYDGPIAAVGPPIPLVRAAGGYYLELRIPGASTRHPTLAAPSPLLPM